VPIASLERSVFAGLICLARSGEHLAQEDRLELFRAP
jgi:hypothetical protein